jgi:hypothetical protein
MRRSKREASDHRRRGKLRGGLETAHMQRAIVALADDYFAKHRDELVCGKKDVQ